MTPPKPGVLASAIFYCSYHLQTGSAGPVGSGVALVWNDFARDDKTRKIHNISDEEMEILSRVAKRAWLFVGKLFRPGYES